MVMFCTPSLESLESRRLLAGASVSHGVLHVVGAQPVGDVIVVNNSVDGKNVDVSISWTTLLHVNKTFTASFPKSIGFKRIDVKGGQGSDLINVGLTNGALGLRVRVDAGRGSDVVNTGQEADVIWAGRGNDVVNAGKGNDMVYGGLGN